MAVNGSNIILLANTGTAGAPTYEAVGSQRDVTFDSSNAIIDISSKAERERRIMAGRYEASISLTHLYVPNDAAYQALKTAHESGDLILVVREESDVSLRTASALVTSLSENAPDQDATTVSITLDIDGAWEDLVS